MQDIPCTRCRVPLPGDAEFCNQCGSPSPARARYCDPVPVGVSGGMAVCLGCGVVAPAERHECASCQLDLPAPSARCQVPRVHHGHYWVAVRCRFQCRVCGHLSPLDHMDMDGSVVCASCGVSQAFDVSSWDEGLAHAHAVGDLAGPDSEGRFPDASISVASGNRYARIGVDETSAELRLSGMVMAGGLINPRSLMVQAAPGQPLCARCRVPLQTVSTHAGEVTVRCAQCAEVSRYRAPASALSACPGLVGVLADEHRADGRGQSREARIDESPGGAIAIRCPNCSAGVTVTGASTIVDCPYCHISLRIPSRVFHNLGRGVPEPLTWWLLFQGPSAERAALMAGRAGADADANKDLGERAAKSIEQGPYGRHSAFVRALGVLVPLIIFLAVGALFFVENVQRWVR